MTQEFVTLQREVVEQALETLSNTGTQRGKQPSQFLAEGLSMNALRAALEQPKEKREPVGEAGPMPGAGGFTMACFRASDVSVGTELYTHPQPKREPLTDEEIDKLCPQFDDPMRREMWIIGFKAARNIK